MDIENIRKLLEQKQKEKEKMDDEDKKRLATIEVLLKDDNVFFRLDPGTACGILNFLGIKEDKKVIDTYYELISYNNYEKGQKYIIKKTNNEEER